MDQEVLGDLVVQDCFFYYEDEFQLNYTMKTQIDGIHVVLFFLVALLVQVVQVVQLFQRVRMAQEVLGDLVVQDFFFHYEDEFHGV